MLETMHLTTAHIAELIASELRRVADEWNITDKVRMLTSDNASNIVAIAKLTVWKHLQCFAHTLNKFHIKK